MKKALIWFFASCALLTADDDSFRERFADPATREAALAELIPGTDEAYFHTALHHQLAGRETEFRKVIADWKAARKDTDDPFYAPPVGLSVLENRQVLLDYEKRPQASMPRTSNALLYSSVTQKKVPARSATTDERGPVKHPQTVHLSEMPCLIWPA